MGKLCPYCRFPIKAGDEVVTCPDCQTTLHADCWRANEGCTTYGCRSSPQVAVARRASRVYGQADASAGSYGSARWGQAVPLGARQLIEAEFDGQCTNALLFTILQLFFCAGFLSIITLVWGVSLLSQMKRLDVTPRPARGRAIAAVVISGGVMLLWLTILVLKLGGSSG